MPNIKKPRVAAIGLDDSQAASIRPLCGDLRRANSVSQYSQDYNWTETDVVVTSAPGWDLIDPRVNLMTVGPMTLSWTEEVHSFAELYADYINTGKDNTERELTVPPSCSDLYKSLAVELSRQLQLSTEPAAVIETGLQDQTSLIETTSGLAIAMRITLTTQSDATNSHQPIAIGLFLPQSANLAAWFRAFLTDIHESDPNRVPHAPPRLSQPSDWYTPEEKTLADRISEIQSEFERLTNEKNGLQTELAAQGEKAEGGIRRAIWADGDELVSAVKDVLFDLGFKVKDMDAELKENEPKREDLRLTLQDSPGWEAIVEVKGYPSGTKTNDGHQIRSHRDRYIKEKLRSPDLTIWLANEYRMMDPSSRPAPDQNVKTVAELVGAVHVLSSDLYQQWTLVAAGRLDRELVIKSLRNALPGLWTSPASDSGA